MKSDKIQAVNSLFIKTSHKSETKIYIIVRIPLAVDYNILKFINKKNKIIKKQVNDLFCYKYL